MNRVQKFVRLSRHDRLLILKAVALVGLLRLLLWVLPFPRIRPLLERTSRRSVALADDPTPVEKFAWAVTAGSRIIPGGKHCLTQALALQQFLSRRGHSSRIRFGVQRIPGAPFQAHAWVECDGVVLIGGQYLHRFVPLAPSAEVSL